MHKHRRFHETLTVPAVLALSLLALPVAAPAASLTLTSGLGLSHLSNLVISGSFENQASGSAFFTGRRGRR